MNEDSKLIRTAIRTVDNGKEIVISVGTVVWDGPHTPERKWIRATSVPTSSTQDEIDQATREVLNNKRFFRVCPECNERRLLGHMMEHYCQACGEKNHGVAF